MAGRGGLNLTNAEPFEVFLARYGAAASWLRPILEAFPPAALRAWSDQLGQKTFVGSSGRVFPEALKASPLLRAWLVRLATQGVEIRTRHDWLGWDRSGALIFRRADAALETAQPDATILALGGASWPRLGSTGAWAEILARQNIALAPFRPANCGFTIAWTALFRSRFAGQPLKTIALSFGGRTVQGEAVVTDYGIEGGAVYGLAAALRDAIAVPGRAELVIDLCPTLTPAQLAAKLDRPRRAQSTANFLRKAINLSPVAINLLREAQGKDLPTGVAALAALIKAAPLSVIAAQPIERAISTAGGVALEALDDGLMLRERPGVFAAGEMLDWEAPTGGYLLQATLATGVAAARSVLRRLGLD
jgi:uncharacterized flavoprotein (TIGR03862 family)